MLMSFGARRMHPAIALVVDFSLDIVEIDGKPVAKRGKMSGAKQVYRCTHCLDSVILPLKSDPPQCPCGTAMESILSSISHPGVLGKKPPMRKALEIMYWINWGSPIRLSPEFGSSTGKEKS